MRRVPCNPISTLAMIVLRHFLIYGAVLSGLYAPAVHAQEGPQISANKALLAKKLRLIDALDGRPTDVEVRLLLDFCGDKTPIPDPSLVPTEPLTVADAASAKLASLSALPATADIALDYLESNDVSLFQFAAILRSFRLHAIDDAPAARLQDFAARNGVEFERAIAFRISINPQKVDERFDLLITKLLSQESPDSIASACKAILKRETRVLSWNKRLVALCAGPLVTQGYDFRNVVLQALRVNGFPDPGTVRFLHTFRPERETELYWQHKATKYAILGNEEALTEILEALRSDDSRELAAKAMSEHFHIPEKYRSYVYNAAVLRGDLAGAYLGATIINNFSPSGFSKEDLERLERVLTLSWKERFRSWKSSVENN